MNRIFHSMARAFTRGVLIVVPIGVVLFVIKYAVHVLEPLAVFVSRRILRVDPGLFNFSYLLAALLAILIILLAGFIGSAGPGRPIIRWLDKHVLLYVPGYRLLMSAMEATFEPDEALHVKVMLAPVDGWQLAFVMEELENDEVVVFVPQAPDYRTGSVILFHRPVLRETSLTAREAFGILRQGGKGFTRR